MQDLTPGSRSRIRWPATLLVAFAAAAMPACREKPEPLAVHADRIVVSNLTSEPWVDVALVLNGYYKATAPELAPGGQLDAPLARFQSGFGRYYDIRRERVRDVKVTAKTQGGTPIQLAWPAGEQK
jgi:hypothetical protein